MSPINLFRPDQAEGNDELFDTLLKHKNVTIERILSPPETVTEMLTQPYDEWICILQGNARLELGTQIHHLHRGDHMLIPANSPHRVLTTSHRPHCLWLSVHLH